MSTTPTPDNVLPTATTAATPLSTHPVLGRLGWLCARCSRSYSPDVRECVACASQHPLSATYVFYTPSYSLYPPRTYYSASTAGGSTP